MVNARARFLFLFLLPETLFFDGARCNKKLPLARPNEITCWTREAQTQNAPEPEGLTLALLPVFGNYQFPLHAR